MDDSNFSITDHEAPEEDSFNYVYKIDNNDFVFFVKNGSIYYMIINAFTRDNITRWISWPDRSNYFKNYLKNPYVTKLYEHNLFSNTGKPPVTKLIKKIRTMHNRSSWGQKREGVAYV